MQNLLLERLRENSTFPLGLFLGALPSDQTFHELRVEFATLPTGFTVDEITAAVRQLVTVHFEDAPINLTLAIAQPVD